MGAVPAGGAEGAVAASGRWSASAWRPGGAGSDRVRGHVGLHVAATADSIFRAVRATAHRRFSEWSKARVWAKLHRVVLDELGARGELDWTRCTIDSVNMRALKRGT